MSARNTAVSAIVALVEQSQTTYPELGDLQVISVSILHRGGPGESPMNWHTEDVIEFRKGSSQRFSIHMT